MASFGWRWTHIGVGIFCAVAMSILLLVLRSRFDSARSALDVQQNGARIDLRLPPNALTALLCLAAVGCCTAMAMPQVHIVAYCGDLGYGVAHGAEMLALMLGFGVVSRIGSGLIADRIGGLPTLLLGSIAQAFALVLYLAFDGLASLYVISALFGFFQGGIVPSYTMIIRETMPASQAGTRVGIVVLFSVIGMALGGWLSGAIFDATGSYAAAFANSLGWNALNLFIVVCLMMRRGWRLGLA